MEQSLYLQFSSAHAPELRQRKSPFPHADLGLLSTGEPLLLFAKEQMGAAGRVVRDRGAN